MASKRILLIEDDREISSTLSGVLDGAGYDVITASNGIDGQRLIDSQKPDLVITDMMMPRLGGFPVLEFLKTLASPPKVIMITANEGGRHKAYAEMLGVVDYLRKPFAMDMLLDAVAKALADVEDSGDPAPGAGPLRRTRPAKKKDDSLEE
jgi:DNA-binding response OmpR family regulator